ncbi:hypothetical protein IQ07DRAFT_604677 [Pyrenochaeta sp. DS3sAY3a]|nr:hypothetical protein IQ07DRAFT_604677 [Pyrenochaeta sp. DS3sAY3a]
MANVSAAEFAQLKPLPKPLCQSANTTNEMLKRMRNASSPQASAIPDGRSQFSSDADPYCGYDEAIVDKFVEEGVSVQDIVAVLQRLGVSFFSLKSFGMFFLGLGRLTTEKPQLLGRALAREIDLDGEGRIL